MVVFTKSFNPESIHNMWGILMPHIFKLFP